MELMTDCIRRYIDMMMRQIYERWSEPSDGAAICGRL
jgi:hypothetical protein